MFKVVLCFPEFALLPNNSCNDVSLVNSDFGLESILFLSHLDHFESPMVDIEKLNICIESTSFKLS